MIMQKTIINQYSLFQPVEPALNPCVYYLSVRGFDRLINLATFIIAGKSEAEKSDQFCGTVDNIPFCYTFCKSLRPGAVTNNPTDLVCIVYNNGYPPKPNLLPEDIESIPLAFPPSHSSVKCGQYFLLWNININFKFCNVYSAVPASITNNYQSSSRILLLRTFWNIN